MYITILQALNIAVEAIRQLPDSDENRQAITRLTNLKNKDLYVNWTKELVFKKLNDWKKNHDNRNPNATCLAEHGMPKAHTIQRLFDMKASAFFNIYYPNDNSKKTAYTPYSVHSKEEYVELFIKEYNRIKPRTSKEYNVLRNKDTPTWLTIAKYVGVTTWRELLEITKVDISCSSRMKKTARSFNITHQVELYDKLENYLKFEQK